MKYLFGRVVVEKCIVNRLNMKYMSNLNEIQELKEEFVTRLIDHMSQNTLQKDERMEKLFDIVSFPSKMVLQLLRSLLDSVKNEDFLIAERLKQEMLYYIDVVQD